jgi:hypothetical protein
MSTIQPEVKEGESFEIIDHPESKTYTDVSMVKYVTEPKKFEQT